MTTPKDGSSSLESVNATFFEKLEVHPSVSTEAGCSPTCHAVAEKPASASRLSLAEDKHLLNPDLSPLHSFPLPRGAEECFSDKIHSPSQQASCSVHTVDILSIIVGERNTLWNYLGYSRVGFVECHLWFRYLFCDLRNLYVWCEFTQPTLYPRQSPSSLCAVHVPFVLEPASPQR